MQILITPEDIIRRCLWIEYKRFCLRDKNDEDIKKIIEENKPVALKEEDAYVIGLLKVVETPNLVHRLKEHMDEVLKIRSNIFNNKLYIIKSVAMKEISTFVARFPEGFKPPFEYKKGIEDLKEFSTRIYADIDKLQTYSFASGDKIYTYISSNGVKTIVDDKDKEKDKDKYKEIILSKE
jgi:translation initiation factor 2B subunit (eIF-2B alpha/beta/delta family)